MLASAQPTPDRKRLVMITGVQRSGTTAVFEALSRSPGVTARNEAADDDIYKDYFLQPEPQMRSLLHALPGTVLLKPVRETERRPLDAIANEYADYDLRIIWLYRDPVNVFSSFVRLGWLSLFPHHNVVMFADRWCVRNETALAAAPALGDRLVIANYEDLCSDPALLPKLAAIVGLSSCATLRHDSQGGRQDLPQHIQADIDAMTRDVTRKLADARGVWPAGTAASRIPAVASPHPMASPHAASAFIREEYAELLQAPDLASVYRRWHAAPDSRGVSGSPASPATIGYEDSQCVLAASAPVASISRTACLRDDAHAALELLFAESRVALHDSIRRLVQRRVEEQGTSRPFMLPSLLTSIVREVNAAWMDCPAPCLDRACLGVIMSIASQALVEMPHEVATAIADVQSTGLLRRLLDRGVITAEDVPAFIHDTAVQTYLLTTVVTNSLLVAARHPPILDQLREAPAKIPGFLVEALRVAPSFVGVRRRCNESVRVAGLDLSADTTVDVIVGAANRDPSVFPDPDRCLLDRTGPLPILLEAATANYLRLRDDAPWPAGSLLLDTAAITLEALVAGDRPLRIMSEPNTLLVPWPDGSFIPVPGEMLVALGD